MKKYILMLSCLLMLSSFSACSSPTQVIAEDATKRGVKQETTIVNDLALMAGQSSLDEAKDDINEAVNEKDSPKAQAALLKHTQNMETIWFLKVQHERALALIRIGQRYIWEQKGWFNILMDEWDQAKKIEAENATTQPASK